MNWQDKQTVKKGNIGEEIVNDYLTNKGWVVYEPITDKAHGFDRLVSIDRKRLVIAEIKTKARRNRFPDTGIDFKHYIEYKQISERHNLPVHLFFVDEMLGQIYGEALTVLEKPDCHEHKGEYLSYPMVKQHKDSKIIYFYQPKMKVIHTLTEEQILLIKQHNTRSYDYAETVKIIE